MDVGARANCERHGVSALVDSLVGMVVHLVCRHARMIRPEGGVAVGSRVLLGCPVLVDGVAHSSTVWHLGYSDGLQGVCGEDPGWQEWSGIGYHQQQAVGDSSLACRLEEAPF